MPRHEWRVSSLEGVQSGIPGILPSHEKEINKVTLSEVA